MARYAAGDPEAFGELFRRYEPRAYGFFLRQTSSPQRAEDLYQELFLRIHRSRDRYDPTRPVTPWRFQIANRPRSLRRSATWRRLQKLEIGYPELAEHLDAVKKMASRAIPRLRAAAVESPLGASAS